MNGSKTVFGSFRCHSILSITLIISAIALLAVWDWYRVDRDYVRLKDFLKNTRMSVLYDRSPKIARFLDGQVIVDDFKTGEAINHIAVPTLHRVRYL